MLTLYFDLFSAKARLIKQREDQQIPIAQRNAQIQDLHKRTRVSRPKITQSLRIDGGL